MGLFSRKNKAPSAESAPGSNPNSGYESLRNVQPNNAIMLGQQAPREPEIPKAAKGQSEKELIKHKTKAIEYFVNGDINSNQPVTNEQIQMLYHQLNTNQIDSKTERNFLSRIARPMDNPDGTLNQGAMLGAFSTVLQYGPAKDVYQKAVGKQDISSYDFKDLLYQYPTPVDFREIENAIMDDVVLHDKAHYDQVSAGLKAFKNIVYGKQNEYYEGIRELRHDAQTHSNTFNIPKTQVLQPQANEAYRKYGEQKEALKDPNVAFRSMSVREKFAWFEQNGKRMISGQNGYEVTNANNLHVENEDTPYINLREKVVAMFDGAGGSANGARASQTCAKVLDEFLQKFPFNPDNYPVLRNDPPEETPTTKWLRHAASYIQNTLERDSTLNGSYSTGLITKLSEDNRRLDFVNIGDSRLYRIRNGKVEQISTDQGFGNKITSSLGTDGYGNRLYDMQPNIGSIDIEEGDTIIVCSDGFDGDYPQQEVDRQDIINVINNNDDPQTISDYLAWLSKKSDDTSIVTLKF